MDLVDVILHKGDLFHGRILVFWSDSAEYTQDGEDLHQHGYYGLFDLSKILLMILVISK